jgi:nucleoside-diphosphate-sugar epimerase
MRIFLTGATGYIGDAVLEALGRAGHDVTVLVRNAARLTGHASRHTRVVVANLAEPATWAEAVAGHDVLIHTAFEGSARGPAVDRAALDTLVAEGRRSARDGHRVALIYTSGVWVLGDTTRPAGEDAPLAPTPMVAWRPAHEQLMTDANGNGLRTAVIRPGIVFGGTRGIVSELMRDAANGLIRVVGSGQNRWPLVYVRDLAELYVKVATTPDAAGIFHATDDSDERVMDIVDAIAHHLPVKPDVRHVPIEEARAKYGAYADAIVLDQVVRSPRSRAIGWHPRFNSISANVSRVFEEWRRGQEDKAG